jgi:hypothetical protein
MDFYNASTTKLMCLMLGGESPVDVYWIVYGAMIKYAKEINCLPFTIEHRYFGESHPLNL